MDSPRHSKPKYSPRHTSRSPLRARLTSAALPAIVVVSLGTVGAAALPTFRSDDRASAYDRPRGDDGGSGSVTDAAVGEDGSAGIEGPRWGTVPESGGLPAGMVPLGGPVRSGEGRTVRRVSFTLPGDPEYVAAPTADPTSSDSASATSAPSDAPAPGSPAAQTPSADAPSADTPSAASPTADAPSAGTPDAGTPSTDASSPSAPVEPSPSEPTATPTLPVATEPGPGPTAPTVTPTPADPTTPAAGSVAPGRTDALPVGDLPGWHQVLAEDFGTDAPLGSFLSTYGSTWSAYPSPWPDTSHNGRYDAARTLSVAGSVLDIHLHTENGVHYVAAPTPKLPAMTYGRYSVRFQADPVPGYKTAWLLWPDDDQWPAHGEIDFPEGDLDSTINAFAHFASAGGGQDPFSTTATYGSWHTSTVEWMPGKIVFYLDGRVIGTSTRNVPSTPMHWVLQTETQLSGGAPADSADGHVRIDWAAAYTYAP